MPCGKINYEGCMVLDRDKMSTLDLEVMGINSNVIHTKKCPDYHKCEYVKSQGDKQ